MEETPRYESTLRLRQCGLLSPTSPIQFFQALNIIGAQGWYHQQLFRLADGLEPELERGLLKAWLAYWQDELGKARAMHRARKRRDAGMQAEPVLSGD